MSIKFEKVDYVYSPGTSMEKKGLDNVSFEIADHSFVALIGHTGSGKSTMMQHFNALLKPSTGTIDIAGYHITSSTSNKNLKNLRKQVSLVFQFPEAQLFENTVLEDVEFGPKNFGASEVEAKKKALKWLKKVGLSESIISNSPFELSGGQMRRVAIAGVMAIEPQVLCLDEPAAGLDPRARREMMQLFVDYQKAGHTVILVTHNMNDVAEYADDVLVMENGKLIKHARPEEVFADKNWLKRHYLDEPTPSLFASSLSNFNFEKNPLTLEQLANEIKDNLWGEASE
ncbi:energy-coupling factor transporter ATPase [Lactobacillus kefiranofaciens]|uniref:Energy-coupling factor transporter ATP-binding protein EcfA2 n=1 Tax=Lactobacillus kefiranofaciens TaxID=267818 RepID=A0AAX3UB37_9LACO|nr:energy-coupling factor transporter ATPase [Lactobacillus kefiranofaciens]MCP9330391.1 energy-coupling factor transporter ATPase [Lactobacillus kefiranofaciens]MDF4143181.1 energy-coupling factor transporter ATPase [Lactobacillus kefiranofaciens]PAK99255.1 energy-coupling factor transporter ATPase [Lactobacillus kefiranofaciens]QFQ67336.1 energy-coupling factor transporter ATPase [Lactobacillus kefiranofaciens subsp. kefiranofaciens]URW71414.1 energy-coupling factor transporter ATPase [Lacto